MRHALVLLPALALAFLPARGEDEKKEKPSEKVRAWLGGEHPVAVIRWATRVEVFRVFPEKPNEPMGKECAEYPVQSSGKEQDAKFAARIAEALFEEKTYDFEKAKKCEFEPGVGFRLWRDKDFLDVVICFSCDELEVCWKKRDEKTNHISREDCDAARKELLKLAKEAFPDDKEIQELPEKRAK